MDLRQIRYFTAVAETLNFTQAAQRLNITQPPLTRQIQALEQQLGVRLFDRLARGVQLTAAGHTLLAEARHLKTLVDQSVLRAQHAAQGELGRLDVGYFGTSALQALPRVLAAYRAAHPAVEVVLHPGQTPSQLLALRQGRVAIVFERQLPPPEPDLQLELVTREAVLAALPAAHRLAGEEVVDVEDLRDEPMILPMGLPPQMTGMAARVFQAHGFQPREAQRCLDMTSGTLLVACGVGVFLVPASMAAMAMPGVVYRPLRTRSAATFDLYCFCLRERRSALVDGLLQTVRALRALQEAEAMPAQAERAAPVGERSRRKPRTTSSMARSSGERSSRR